MRALRGLGWMLMVLGLLAGALILASPFPALTGDAIKLSRASWTLWPFFLLCTSIGLGLAATGSVEHARLFDHALKALGMALLLLGLLAAIGILLGAVEILIPTQAWPLWAMLLLGITGGASCLLMGGRVGEPQPEPAGGPSATARH